MARRTKEDAEKTRQQILDAAAAAFDAEGVAACALEHVARLAGVTRGAIYWHFKNKSDLLDAMLERVRLPQEQVMQDLAAGRITDRRPLDLFHESSRDALSMIVNDERRRLVFRIIFTRIDQGHDHSPLHERQQADRVHFMTLIRQIMARAATAGDLVISRPLASGRASARAPARRLFSTKTGARTSLRCTARWRLEDP